MQQRAQQELYEGVTLARWFHAEHSPVLVRGELPGRMSLRLSQKLQPSHLPCGCGLQLQFQQLEKDQLQNPEQTFLPTESRNPHQLMKQQELKSLAQQQQGQLEQPQQLAVQQALQPLEEQPVLGEQRVLGEPEQPLGQLVPQPLVLRVQPIPNQNQ
jgi:hypothetical protein